MLSLLNDFEAIGSAEKFTYFFNCLVSFDISRSLYITVNHPATKDYQTNVLSCQVNDDIV